MSPEVSSYTWMVAVSPSRRMISPTSFVPADAHELVHRRAVHLVRHHDGAGYLFRGKARSEGVWRRKAARARRDPGEKTAK